MAFGLICDKPIFKKKNLSKNKFNEKFNKKYRIKYLQGPRYRIPRVATAQGKQGIWLLTFPDGKHREFSKLIFFTQGKWCQHRENFEFFENFVIKVATR